MLQARIMSDPDAQGDRLGGNISAITLNQPKCPVMHHQRNGFIALVNNCGKTIIGKSSKLLKLKLLYQYSNYLVKSLA